jgi:foldase protein PrsA
MKKSSKLLTVFLAALMILGILGGCANAPVSEEGVLARVWDEKIEQADLENFVKVIYLLMPEAEEYYKGENLENLEKEVLTFLIETKVLQREIKNLGLAVQDGELEKGIEQLQEELITHVYETKEKFEDRLTELEIGKDLLRMLALDTRTKELLYEHVISGITEEDVRQFATENPQFMENPASANIYHILLEEEEEAKKVHKLLEEGADFMEMGKEYSLDSHVDLGRVGSQDMYDPDFLEAAFKLKPGEISLPVKTSFGYHLIMITDKEEARELSFEEVREEITDYKKRVVYDEYLENLFAEAEVETLLDQ